MGGSSSQPQVPQMSRQEKDLMSQQTALLQQQQVMTQKSFDTQNLLAPFLYKSLGLTPTMDAKGNITGFSQDPTSSALQDKENSLTSSLLDREQAALDGKLPVDPALLDSLDQSEAQLHEQLSKNLGPGYATSSSGIAALDRFSTSKNSILEGARRGDLTMAEQLALGMQGGAQSGSQFLMQGSSGLAGTGANYGAMFGQAAAGYNGPLSMLENTRAMQFQSNEAGFQSNNSMMSGLGSGLGNLLGIGLAAGLTPAKGASGFLL